MEEKCLSGYFPKNRRRCLYRSSRSRQNGKIYIYKKVYGFACSAQYP